MHVYRNIYSTNLEGLENVSAQDLLRGTEYVRKNVRQLLWHPLQVLEDGTVLFSVVPREEGHQHIEIIQCPVGKKE